MNCIVIGAGRLGKNMAIMLCKKHNVKFYDIDVYNLIKNNYPAFLVQD